MNKMLLILFVFLSVKSFGQNTANIAGGNINTKLVSQGALTSDSMFINAKAPDSLSRWNVEGGQRYFTVTHSMWYKNNISWTEQLSKLKSQAIITSIPVVGDTATTAADFVGLFFKSQSPMATLTGGTTIEFTSAGTVAETLNWSASRQFATQPLASIVVATVSQSFSQPSAPGTVNGTQNVSVPANTTTTYSNIVTTTDGKTATATTQFIYRNKIYAGFVSGTSPTSSEIISATGSSYVGGEFSTTRNQSGSLSAPSGSKYVMFASPVSFGMPNITINGLGVTYTITTVSFTNASGYVSNYYVAISPFPTSGAIDSYVVN